MTRFVRSGWRESQAGIRTGAVSRQQAAGSSATRAARRADGQQADKEGKQSSAPTLASRLHAILGSWAALVVGKCCRWRMLNTCRMLYKYMQDAALLVFGGMTLITVCLDLPFAHERLPLPCLMSASSASTCGEPKRLPMRQQMPGNQARLLVWLLVNLGRGQRLAPASCACLLLLLLVVSQSVEAHFVPIDADMSKRLLRPL